MLPEWQGGKVALLMEGASAFWCFRTFAVLRIEWPVQLSVIGKVELPRVLTWFRTRFPGGWIPLAEERDRAVDLIVGLVKGCVVGEGYTTSNVSMVDTLISNCFNADPLLGVCSTEDTSRWDVGGFEWDEVGSGFDADFSITSQNSDWICTFVFSVPLS